MLLTGAHFSPAFTPFLQPQLQLSLPDVPPASPLGRLPPDFTLPIHILKATRELSQRTNLSPRLGSESFSGSHRFQGSPWVQHLLIESLLFPLALWLSSVNPSSLVPATLAYW